MQRIAHALHILAEVPDTIIGSHIAQSVNDRLVKLAGIYLDSINHDAVRTHLLNLQGIADRMQHRVGTDDGICPERIGMKEESVLVGVLHCERLASDEYRLRIVDVMHVLALESDLLKAIDHHNGTPAVAHSEHAIVMERVARGEPTWADYARTLIQTCLGCSGVVDAEGGIDRGCIIDYARRTTHLCIGRLKVVMEAIAVEHSPRLVAGAVGVGIFRTHLHLAEVVVVQNNIIAE